MLAKTRSEDRSHIELITIYEICRILGDSLDIGRTFRAALNVLAAHLNLPRAMLVMPGSEGDTTLRVHSSVGLDREQEARGQWQHGEGVIGHVFGSGMPVVLPDVAQATEFIDRTGAFSAQADRQMAFVVVPLKTDHAVVGVLAAQRELQGGARLSDDQRILTMVATLLAQSVALHAAVRDEHHRLQLETTRLQKALAREPQGRPTLDKVIGDSRPMQQVFTEVHQAAPSRATVLLRGESGTGKEAIARAIHFLSPRKDEAFIKVNCAALSESLLESELFGHEKGAFTGAVGERKGRFELAHGGTRSSLAWKAGDTSPISSRNRVPPCASSKRPLRSPAAPVKAPFSWPNSSLSSKLSVSAAQFTLMKAASLRGLRKWMARAIASLPVPLSPRSSTVAREGAAWCTSTNTCCIGLDSPTTLSSA